MFPTSQEDLDRKPLRSIDPIRDPVLDGHMEEFQKTLRTIDSLKADKYRAAVMRLNHESIDILFRAFPDRELQTQQCREAIELLRTATDIITVPEGDEEVARCKLNIEDRLHRLVILEKSP